MIIYASIVAAIVLFWFVASILVRRAIPRGDAAIPPAVELPPVSVIVPAMNEEGTIEPAMRSLLALDYPDLEIIAVDDRSTDATGAILDRLAGEAPGRLRVVHVETLPEGWLGKCHALERGAELARGEWILFTDADVLHRPDSIRRALAFARHEGVGHVSFLPKMVVGNSLEGALMTLFSTTLLIGFQAWRVRSRSLQAYIGVGAFNLIERRLYESFGGHRPLRLEVADDMKLAYLAKKHGGGSLLVDAPEIIRVRWREGVLDTVRGLERSAFAGLNFSWLRTIGASVACIVILLAPYILPFIAGSAVVTLLSLVTIGLILGLYALGAAEAGLPLWIGIHHPIVAVLYAVALLRSAVATTARGGLSWRGTFYGIEELKRGTVR